jgi:hypothetical protein
MALFFGVKFLFVFGMYTGLLGDIFEKKLKINYVEDFPKLQFWEIYRGFIGKSGLQAAFSRAFHKTNRVLGKALHTLNYTLYVVYYKYGG